ncbi:MAG: hypothetical protein LQ345_005698 [Seirophora villosa]|nr:MAG: hypothetical protein LQ345_005698 [Seirophora villosa]
MEDEYETNSGSTTPTQATFGSASSPYVFRRNENFYGREQELNTVGQALLPLEDYPKFKVFALCGLGGTGKTEIALEFAYRHGYKFDFVFWAQADNAAILHESCLAISLSLGLRNQSGEQDLKTVRKSLLDWLEKPQKIASAPDGASPFQTTRYVPAKWLLILDGFNDLEHSRVFALYGNGSVLITSRDPSAKMMFSSEQAGLDLPCMELDDGAELLMRLSESGEDQRGAAKNLSYVLGRLPLALSQMARLGRRRYSLIEIWDRYKQLSQQGRLHRKYTPISTTHYPHTIATVWKLDELSPAARALLKVISFLDPHHIQHGLFSKLVWEYNSFPFPKDNFTYQQACNELGRSSLIQQVGDFELSVHTLVQDVTNAALMDEEFDELFNLMVYMIWLSWPSAMPRASRWGSNLLPRVSGWDTSLHPPVCNQRNQVTRWPWCQSLFPHIIRLKDLWDLTDRRSPRFGTIAPNTKLRFAALLNDAVWLRHELGFHEDPTGFLKTSQEVLNQVDHPGKRSLHIDMHFCHGAIAADTNRHAESRMHKEETMYLQLATVERLGTINERHVQACIELAISRIHDGNIDVGIMALERAHCIRALFPIPYLPSSLQAYLGLAYQLEGYLEVSNKLLEESLIIRATILGNNDAESYRTGFIHYALGNLRALQNKPEQSLHHHRQAWDHYQSTVGEWDRRTADAGYKLAEHSLRRGKFDEALTTLQDSFRIWLANPPAYTPYLARGYLLEERIHRRYLQIYESREEEVKRKAEEAWRKALEWRRQSEAEQKRDGKRDIAVLRGSRSVATDIRAFDTLVPFWSR